MKPAMLFVTLPLKTLLTRRPVVGSVHCCPCCRCFYLILLLLPPLQAIDKLKVMLDGGMRQHGETRLFGPKEYVSVYT